MNVIYIVATLLSIYKGNNNLGLEPIMLVMSEVDSRII